jgi:hypothetical protein
MQSCRHPIINAEKSDLFDVLAYVAYTRAIPSFNETRFTFRS